MSLAGGIKRVFISEIRGKGIFRLSPVEKAPEHGLQQRRRGSTARSQKQLSLFFTGATTGPVRVRAKTWADERERPKDRDFFSR
jgi:hypothetical protein